MQEILAHGISRHHNGLSWEEALHAFIGYTDALGFLGQEFVGHARIGVLLLQERGDAHFLRHVERWATGVAPHPNRHLRPKFAHNFPREATALHEFNQNRHVAPEVLAVEACHRKALDFIARSGNTLHLHTAFSSHKQDFSRRRDFAYGIGDGHGWEDMTSRTATADDDS